MIQILKIKFLIILSLFLLPVFLFSQVVLEANGPGNTYELINSVLAPKGGDVVESAECVHPEFGRHIAEVWDADLGKYVFEFYIHVTPDNDRCINFDRQRVEIKTYDASPANLKGVAGEKVTYKWRFKVPSGFQPSSNFTHIHQVKAVDGDDADPIFVLTARKGNPNKLELNYYYDSNQSSQKLKEVNLSLFENTWVEATEQIRIKNSGGSYSLLIKRVSDGVTIMSYSNNDLLTIRADNSFIRPKWGIYRSLLSSQDLRDESLRFAGISISEESISTLGNIYESDDKNFKFTQIKGTKDTNVSFTIGKQSTVTLEVLDTNGKVLLIPIRNKRLSEGVHSEKIDIRTLRKGVYFVRIILENQVQSRKILVCED